VRSAIWRKRYELQKGRGPQAQSLPAVLRDVEESCRMAFRLYRPQPYSGRVTLFRAVIRSGDHEEMEVAWQRLARGGVDVIDVPGSHLTMMSRAHVTQLAETLRARLAEAFEASNAPRPRWPD
jgi:thioesterase domain-containing protein